MIDEEIKNKNKKKTKKKYEDGPVAQVARAFCPGAQKFGLSPYITF
jgi:hypothetical protein